MNTGNGHITLSTLKLSNSKPDSGNYDFYASHQAQNDRGCVKTPESKNRIHFVQHKLRLFIL